MFCYIQFIFSFLRAFLSFISSYALKDIYIFFLKDIYIYIYCDDVILRICIMVGVLLAALEIAGLDP